MITDDLPHALDRLVALGQNRDVNIRPVLLRVLVDMFVTKAHHGEGEIRQFEEIISHLLDDAEDEARLIVAGKLARHPLTPKRLLARFIGERSVAAATVLAHAALDPHTLNAAAVLGTEEMALAVARRTDIDGATARSLAERPETAVPCALADNPAAPLDAGLLRYLVRRARDHDDLAGRLFKRGGDPIESAALFLAADPDKRVEILTAVRRHDLGLPLRGEPVPGAADALARIERAVFLPGMEGLDMALAVALGLPGPDIDRMLDDAGGEPLAIALAALGATPELAARLFILGHPAIGHSYARVKALVRLVETVSPRAARRLITAMTGIAPPSARRPAPALPEGSRDRSRTVLRQAEQRPDAATVPVKRAG